MEIDKGTKSYLSIVLEAFLDQGLPNSYLITDDPKTVPDEIKEQFHPKHILSQESFSLVQQGFEFALFLATELSLKAIEPVLLKAQKNLREKGILIIEIRANQNAQLPSRKIIKELAEAYFDVYELSSNLKKVASQLSKNPTFILKKPGSEIPIDILTLKKLNVQLARASTKEQVLNKIKPQSEEDNLRLLNQLLLAEKELARTKEEIEQIYSLKIFRYSEKLRKIYSKALKYLKNI